MIDYQVGVILPAAGQGERFGSTIPKQYSKILDKPLFLYALEVFQKISYVTHIALVVDDPGIVETILQEYNCHKVIIVQGEGTRHRSIQAGLHALVKQEADLRIVIVHDAVRPIVPSDLLEQLVKSADENGAAGAVCPLVSTVLSTEGDGSLKNALDRRCHLASETPQAFHTNVLISSYEKCTEEDLDCGTECLQLALLYGGVHARLVGGSPNDLWKVTHPRDLYTASECLREKFNSVCIIALEHSEPAQVLEEGLKSQIQTVKRIWASSEEDVQHPCGQKFNNFVFFHTNHIDMESSLLNFATLFDLENQGLIMHIMEQESSEELQSMNVYDLQSSGRKMARQYRKLKKGVVMIHCLDNEADSNSLLSLVTSLLKVHPLSLTGQTLFL